MSYMEVATYLGMLNVALSSMPNREDSTETDIQLNNKMMEALANAQMVMWKLAEEELKKQLGGDKDDV